MCSGEKNLQKKSQNQSLTSNCLGLTDAAQNKFHNGTILKEYYQSPYP